MKEVIQSAAGEIEIPDFIPLGHVIALKMGTEGVELELQCHSAPDSECLVEQVITFSDWSEERSHVCMYRMLLPKKKLVDLFRGNRDKNFAVLPIEIIEDDSADFSWDFQK